ncbi:MAG: RagB/SusD family nutrient uptake outer membrane protein [Bacteroidales bacterium]|nr:RagB/SusD family nutrient uptake outer membrane protein [Bacteroidales bacterium]
MNRTFPSLLLAAAVLTGCSGFLDPLPNGKYTEENLPDYPNLIKGYVYKAYDLLSHSYYAAEFMGMDAATDDAVYRSSTAALRLFATGSATPSSNPFQTLWERDYEGIYYANLFLKDNIGTDTRYLVDKDSDLRLRTALKGDAFALRAWYTYELLKLFGGRSTSGELLGVPLMTEPAALSDMDAASLVRASYDDCARQILADCDSALRYLPRANRDFAVADIQQNTAVLGGVRYGMFDQIAVKTLQAMAYLMWASPAFNPLGDRSRYDAAARLCKEVMDYKTGEEAAVSRFKPLEAFQWSNCNTPEAIWISEMATGTGYETGLYPSGFGGSASIVPSQDLVDAFPAANGYPVTDVRSGYDPAQPYVGRDPRFYSTIYYNGASVRPSAAVAPVYTFNTTVGGADGPGGMATSPTGYYVKKFLNPRWNAFAESKESTQRAIFFMRWTHLCLMFAEAANQMVGPLDADTYGLSARDALAYLRGRTTQDGLQGLGRQGDPYLDECARGGTAAFDALVRNEWRIETCFEGRRYFDLRRWGAPIDGPVHGARITAAGTDLGHVVETRSFPSPWQPLHYIEIRKAPGLFQNEGWETWQ